MRTIDTSQPLSRDDFLYLRDRNRLPKSGYEIDTDDDFTDEEVAYAEQAARTARKAKALQEARFGQRKRSRRAAPPEDLADDVMDEDDDDDEEEEDDDEAVDYSTMKVADLKSELKSRGIDYDDSERTKAPLIKLLESDDEDDS